MFAVPAVGPCLAREQVLLRCAPGLEKNIMVETEFEKFIEHIYTDIRVEKPFPPTAPFLEKQRYRK